MRKYNQLNDVVLSCIVWKWGNLPGWEGPNHEHYRHWAKKSVHLHKWSFLYLEFWLEFSEVSTKFIRLGFLLLCVPFILQIDWSCWLQIKSHPIIWWLLNEVSGQLCTIIIHQRKTLYPYCRQSILDLGPSLQLRVPTLSPAGLSSKGAATLQLSWSTNGSTLSPFATTKTWLQRKPWSYRVVPSNRICSRSNFGTNMSECPISPSISSSLTMAVWAVWAFWPPPSPYLLFVAAQAVECFCWPKNFKMVTADVLPRQTC